MSYGGKRPDGSDIGPHALATIAGVPTGTPTDNLNASDTNFKKIETLSEGTKSYAVTYGVDQQRRKSVQTVNGVTTTHYYLGDYEEEITGNTIRKIHYLSGGNGLAAIYVQNNSNNQDSLMYAYTDNQGSLIALTKENGDTIQTYAYDPWGTRRNPHNWAVKDSRIKWIVNRGYTMHEHIDAFGIINMNGRIYDPQTAMFMNTDPLVQSPDNWVNYNRYSYCFNNPLIYTDPSGYGNYAVNDNYRCDSELAIDPSYLVTPSIYIEGYLKGLRDGAWGSEGGGIGEGGGFSNLDQVATVIVDLLSSKHPYGGTSSGRGHTKYFNSDEEALLFGIAYNNHHNSWGNTYAGSAQGSVNNFFKELLEANDEYEKSITEFILFRFYGLGEPTDIRFMNSLLVKRYGDYLTVQAGVDYISRGYDPWDLLNFGVGAGAFVTGSEFLTGFGWYLYGVQLYTDNKVNTTNLFRDNTLPIIPRATLTNGVRLDGFTPGATSSPPGNGYTQGNYFIYNGIAYPLR